METVESNRNLVCVGKINIDFHAASPEVGELVDTKDFAHSGMWVDLGGASANVARAINTLSRVYDDPGSTKIVTRIGQPPEEEGYKTFGEHLFAQHATDMTFSLLQHEGLNYIDVAAGQMGPGIAKSMVSGWNGGRHIYKQKSFVGPQFNAVNDGLLANTKPIIEAEVSNAAYVFVDPARPGLANLTTEICEERGIPTIVDHGLKAWPTDEKEAAILDNILKKADILIVPSDAVVPGMRDKESNPDRLFELLHGKEYKARTIIMSDGTNPVRLSHNGKVTEIPVMEVENPINVSGAGDTRDGALMFYLSRGDDMETAVTKATVMASIRIQYRDNDWEGHIYDHVVDNPLFADDVEELTAHHNRHLPTFFDQLPDQAENDPDGGLDEVSNE